MTKRSLLAVAIATLGIQSAQAAPFLPMDARGLAMGNTGVASAQRAHAPAYNPSLLSQASDDDDFALLFPQVGVSFADEEEMIDEAEILSDEIIPRFESTLDGADGLETALSNFTNNPSVQNRDNLQASLTNVEQSITELDESLKNISGSPLSAKVGLNFALAIPSKKFSAALSAGGTASISGRVAYSPADSTLFTSYVPEVQRLLDFVDDVDESVNSGGTIPLPAVPTSDIIDYSGFDDTNATTAANTVGTIGLSDAASNPDLKSSVQVVAVAIADIGLSFSREFDFAGEKVAIGLTPKLQKITTYHYADEIDGFDEVDEDSLEDSKEEYSKVNLDIGASYRFGSEGNWVAGLVGKNLLGGEFDYADVVVTPKDSNGNPDPLQPAYSIDGGSVNLNPQFRAGIAYQSSWVNVALDVDLTENDPIAFESATQYAAIGAEFDLFSTLQLRAGYRTNMSTTNADMVSVGLGLSPFGIHLDIAAMANPSDPEKEAGVALETGFYF